MVQARNALRRRLPFSTPLLLRFMLVEMRGCGTAQSTAQVGFSTTPDWHQDLTENAAMTVLNHELSICGDCTTLVVKGWGKSADSGTSLATSKSNQR